MDANIGAITIAVVAAIRSKFPEIDGIWVLLVASVLGAALGWLTLATDPRSAIISGIASAVAASGVLSGASYVLAKGLPKK